MAMLDWLLGAFMAKRAENAVSRPTVICTTGDYEIIRMKPKGMKGWDIWARRIGSRGGADHTFSVYKDTVRHSIGGSEFDVFWP